MQSTWREMDTDLHLRQESPDPRLQSDSTLAMVTMSVPENFSANSSQVGANLLQWPHLQEVGTCVASGEYAHHGAKNLTNTGFSAPTVSAKVSLSRDTGISARACPTAAAISRQTASRIFSTSPSANTCHGLFARAHVIGGVPQSCRQAGKCAAPLCGCGCAL